MEMSLAYGVSVSRALCFKHGVLRIQLPILTTEKSSTSNHNHRNSHSIAHGSKKKISAIKALKTTSSARRTLSNNWDVSQDISSVISTPRLPRLEDLDTTNMLLRQRIIFLGSQVDGSYFSSLILLVISFFYMGIF